MNKKSKFLAVLLLVVFALSMVVFGVACKKDKGNTGDTGSTGSQSESKTATYYTDTVDGEYVVELFGNDCLLKIGSETMLGKFTLNSGAITFTTDKGTFEGTITGDEIDFTYDGRQYLMLEKVERTVRFSDGTEQKVLNGKTAVKPAADPAAPDNKAFVGWYADESYTNLYNFGTPVRGDISVYARMVDNPVGGMVYTATAIYDDGSKKEIKTVGGKVYGLETLAEKDGKAFDGWYVSDFNSADKLTYKYNESIALNQNVNLYPVWKDGITGLSVTSEKVTWDSYATGAKYDIKVSSNVSAGTQQTVSQTEFKISDYLKVAGEYVVTVSTDGVSKTAYYINKALARPTVEIIDGTTVKYNAVANAEKYLVTVDCGNPDHRHTQFDNGTSTVYDISSCEMQKGGIKVYVEAKANGFVSATSEVCRFERNLDAVKGVVINGNELVWNTVDKAISYVVVIDGKEYNVGAVNSYSLKSVASGEHTVGVYPVAKGYNSPEATTAAPYNKVQLATPTGVTLVDGKIVWNEVAGATAYTVKIGDVAVTSDTNSVDFKTEYLSGKSSVAISVCAIVSGDASKSSEYSDACRVNYGTLENIKYENGVVTWDPVATANGYVVTVGGAVTTVKNGTSAKIEFRKGGVNDIKVAYTMEINGRDREVGSATISITAYEVKFYNTDGTYNSVYAAYGDEVSAVAKDVPGYHFSGWYDIPNGGKHNGNKFTSGVIGKVGDTSLYAYLSPNKYTITYDATYGEVSKESDDVYYSESFKLAVPTSKDENLVFDGWYTDANGAGTRYTDSLGNSVKNWIITDGATLKANWKKLFEFKLNTEKTGYNVSGGDALENVTEATIPEQYEGKPILMVDDLSTGISLEKIKIPRYSGISVGDGEGVMASAFKSCKNLAVIEVYEPKEEQLKKLDVKFVTYDGVIYEITKTAQEKTDAGVITKVAEAKLSMVPLGKSGEMTVYDKTTEINSYAFNKSIVEKVTIPASVTTVKSNAFTSCGSLKEVVFENKEDAKALTIETKAFEKCGKLEKVDLPARMVASTQKLEVKEKDKSKTLLKDVEYSMDFDEKIFTSCSAIKEVNIVGTYANAAYSSNDGIIYNANGTKIIYCPKGRVNPVVMATKVTTIGAAAFYGCSKIEKVEVGAPVTAIDEFAFAECSAVNDLTFKGTKDYNALTIKFGAFLNNKMLTEVTLPENLSSMDTCAFGGTALLKTVTLNSVGENGKVNFADGVFGSNSKTNPSYYVQMVMLGEKTPAFGIASVFGNKIISFTVSEANVNYEKGEKDEYYGSYVTSDGKTYTMLVYAPTYITGDFVVKSGVNKICANVFNGNTNLESIFIPATVDSIGTSAFRGASALRTVTFEADAEGGATRLDIENGAFNQCSSLAGTIVFPARLTKIGDSAFMSDGKLAGVTFSGTKLEAIGNAAFKYCKVMTEIVLPIGVKTLGDEAFCFCNSLESFHIPSTVETIGTGVLASAESLQSITVDEKNTKFRSKDGILYGLDETTQKEDELILCPMGNSGTTDTDGNVNTVHIPNTVTSVATNTFKSNTGIEQIIFDDNAEGSTRDLQIGEEAFHGYTKARNKIKKIVLPEGMTTITAKTFYWCYATEIVIPTSVTLIEKQAFINFMGDTITFKDVKDGETGKALVIDDGNASGSQYSLGAFANCYYLTTIKFPERTTKIGAAAFYSSSNLKLKTVVIPSTVTTIGAGAFYNAKELTSFTITDDPENGKASKLATIGNNAFYGFGCANITLPDSVTSIGERAFGSSLLTSVTIPKNVSSIGTAAFNSSSSLVSVTFAKGCAIEAINESVFYWCKNLTTVGSIRSVTVGETSQDEFVEGALPFGVKTIGKNAFYYSKLKTIKIPAKIETIGDDAFGATLLDSVVFEVGVEVEKTDAAGNKTTEIVEKNNLSSIGKWAFRKSNISEFVIPESTASAIKLGTDIFQGCFALTSITIPTGVKTGLEDAIKSCSSITTVTIAADSENYQSKNGIIYNKAGDTLVYCYVPAAVDENGVLNITAKNVGASAYAGQPGIKKVVFSKDITTIDTNAFEGCSNLTTVEFDKESGSILAIPDYAFNNCTSLTTVANMPASITKIGDNAFSGCKSLKSITYGTGVTTIGDYAFQNSGLTEITFPKTLETLGSNVFSGCAAVTQGEPQTIKVGTTSYTLYKPVAISLPNTIKSIGNNAFRNIQISSLTLPNNQLTSIGNYAFNACFASKDCAKTVTIPSTVTSLGMYAFADNAYLQKVDFAGTTQVPAKIGSINNYAFKNSGLTRISLPASVKTLGSNAFENCASLKTVEFAEDIKITEIKSATFKGCAALESITIPDGVKTIGANSFENCTALEVVNLPSTVTYIGKAAFMKSGITEIVIPEGVRFLSKANRKTTSTNDLSGEVGESSYSTEKSRLDPAEGKINSSSTAQFAFCANLTKVTLSSKLEEIGAYAFFATPNLTTITYTGYEGSGNALPEKLSQICGYAFSHSGVDSIKTTSNVKLNKNVFADSKLKDVDISSCASTSELPQAAFAYTTELNSIVFPEKITVVGESAFEESAIETINLPSSVYQLNKKAFKNSNILSIDLSNVVAYIAKGTLSSGDGFFSGCKNLANVVLNNKLDTLPNYMFEGCEGLMEINIPNSVTTIGKACFSGSGLRQLYISKNVTSMGSNALLAPSLLYADQDGVVRTHITIDSANGTYYMKDNQLYEKTDDGDEIATFFATLDANKTLTVPDGVVTLSECFAAYPDVKKVILPKSVKYVQKNAFMSCYNLETVEMPAVETIGVWAFRDCYKLKYVKLPSTLTDLGSQAFCNSSAFAEGGLTLDMSEVNGEVVADSSNSLLLNCRDDFLVNGKQGVHGVKKVILPSNITEIPNRLFKACSNLEWVTYYTDKVDSDGNKILAGADKGNGVYLPEGVTYINYGAFTDCSKITYAEIPASVTGFGDGTGGKYTPGVFQGCAALEEVKFLGEGITEIAAFAFKDCTSLAKVNVPSTVTAIKQSAFSGCVELSNVGLLANVTEVYGSAFLNCAKFKGMDTSAVTYFGVSAFSGSGITEAVVNSNVVSMTVNNTTYSVGSTFADCTELTKVTFGPEVNELCSSMFKGCTKLTSITLPEKLIEIETSMFEGSGLTSVVIPDSVTAIWGNAFTNCVDLETVTIGENVDTIQTGFHGCTSLKELYISKNVKQLTGTNFKGWGENQTVKFELTEYQVSKLFGLSWKDASCNAKFEFGVAPAASAGSENGNQTEQAA